MSTITTIPLVFSSPRDDAMHLYKAFEGLGCDTETVINILAHRDSSQRALIEMEYKTMYHEELTKRLSSELSGNCKKAVLLWMPDPARRDAMVLHEALTTDIDIKAVIEVICSRTPAQLHHVKQLYHSLYKTQLEHAIQTQASGDLEKLLLAYLSSPRNEGLMADRMMAAQDAKALFKAGEKRLGTDEKTFRMMFTGKCGPYLASVSSAYHDMYGTTLKKAVKGQTSGNVEHAMVTILQCAENRGKYFAKVLHRAMKGVGTDDKTLIRVIVTKAEIDMQFVKEEYHMKHHKSLYDAVHSETSGHYRTFLLSLVGPNRY